MTLVSGWGIALVVFWVLDSAADSGFALGWILTISLVTLIRLIHGFYSSRRLSQKNASSISQQYLSGSIAGGLCWGSLILGYDPSQPLFIQLFILITLIGMPVASMISNAFCIPVFLGFSLPVLCALGFWSLFLSQALRLEFTLMTGLYAFLIIGIARRYFITLRGNFERAEENRLLLREVKEANARLLHLAYHDPLTELSNRRQFEINATHLLSRLGSVIHSLALMLIDLDNFKTVNDTLGHKAGDLLLQEISRRILASSRQSELILQGQLEAARIGGDEFIIIYQIEPKDAEIGKLAERVLQSLCAPVQLNDTRFTPSVSIGIALAPRDASNLDDLVKIADAAMYRAKNAGGNRYRIAEAA